MALITLSCRAFIQTSASSARTPIAGHMANTSQPYAHIRFRAPSGTTLSA